MKNTSDRVALADVRDLLHVGSPLPFRVLDAQERLPLNQGPVILDEAQFQALVDRGAWAERSLVDAERRARAAAATTPVVVQLSLFDRWERLLWQFDKLARGLVRQEVPGSNLPPFSDSLRALVDRNADIALFLCTRQDDHGFALYPLRHAIHPPRQNSCRPDRTDNPGGGVAMKDASGKVRTGIQGSSGSADAAAGERVG